MNELQKIESFENSLALAETFEEIKLLDDSTSALLAFAKKQKISDDGINRIGEFLVKVVSRKGQWLDEYFPTGAPAGNQNASKNKGTKSEPLKMPTTKKESAQARMLATTSDEDKAEIMQELKDEGEYVLPKNVAKKIKEKKKKKERNELEEQGKGKKIDIDFRLGDFEEVFKDIPDGSVDCIITDPPYPVEFIECWSKLSRFAKRVLKPHGYCIAYSGQMNLPEVIKRMSEHLDYYWTFATYHEGLTQIVNGVNIICRWKPVLIYQNGKKKLPNTFQDYFISENREKDGHDWQQSNSGASYLIEMFTNPGDLICEPFAGSGTTIKASLAKGRSIIAAEIDEETYNIAKAGL